MKEIHTHMTANSTPVPGTSKKRNSKGAVAIGLAALLAIGGGIGVTLATQSSKDSTAVEWETQLLKVTSSETAAFNLTPGVTTPVQQVTITHAGGPNIAAHAGFAATPFIPTAPAALDDTVVRVWDVGVSGEDDPSTDGNGLYWEGTLRDFLNTSFISNTLIRGGESTQFGIAVATPYDVDANDWLMGEIAASINRSEFISLAVQADPTNESDLSKGSIFDGAAGLRTANASLVLAAAADLNGSGPVVGLPAFEDDAQTVPGSVIRTFYTDPSMTTGLGSILLDASKGDGDDGRILNSDYDGDGTHLNLYGIVQAG